MKLLLAAAVLAAIAASAFADERDIRPGPRKIVSAERDIRPVPAEIISIHKQVPDLAESIPFSNTASQANMSAVTSQIGTVAGGSVSGIANAVPMGTIGSGNVSGIGNAVPVFTAPIVPASPVLNSIGTPRLR